MALRFSAYTIVTEPELMGFPYLEAVQSFARFMDEVVVVAGRCEASSEASLRALPNVKYINTDAWPEDWDYDVMRYHFNLALQECTGDVAIKFDADHVLSGSTFPHLAESVEDEIGQTHFWYLRQANVLRHDFVYMKEGGSASYVVNKRLFRKQGRSVIVSNASGSNVPVAESGETTSTRLPHFFVNYDNTFMTKEQIIKRWRAWDCAFIRTIGKSMFTPPLDGVPDDEMVGVMHRYMKGRFRHARPIRLHFHPAVIRDRIASLSPEQWGYSCFDISIPLRLRCWAVICRLWQSS